MATSVIDPDNGSGTDYLSLDAWITGEAGDQSAAECVADCKSTGGSDDTAGTLIVIEGFTNYTGMLTVKADDPYRHDGTMTGNTYAYKYLQGTQEPFRINQVPCKVEGIIIENNDDPWPTHGILLKAATGSTDDDAQFIGNLLWNCETPISAGYHGVYPAIVCANNICVANDATSSFGIRISGMESGEFHVLNNTCIGDGSNGLGLNNIGYHSCDFYAYNNIFQDYATCMSSAGLDGSDCNITDDATSPNVDYRNITLDFAGTDDYHLHADDTDAIEEGTDLSGYTAYNVTVDIDGDSRDGSTPDIGADEYVSASTIKDVVDTGGGADAVAITATIAVSDTGSGADALVVAVALALADAGAGSDSLLPSALALIADAAAGAESATISVSAAIADAGTGAEVASISAAFSVADSASGADIISVTTEAIKLVSDTATGSDTVAPTVVLSVADAGSGADSSSIDVALSIADTGTGVDVIGILQSILVAVADSGGGIEALGVNVSVEVPDTATGTEALSINSLVEIVEAAGGTDIVIQTEPGLSHVSSMTFTLSGRSVTFTLTAKSITFTLQ